MADTANPVPNADDTNENPYVKAVNKRLRLVKKKLQKIDAMEGKDASALDEGQKALLQNKPTLKILNDELTQILSAFETVDLPDAPAPEEEKKEGGKKNKKGDKAGKAEKPPSNEKQPDAPQDSTTEPEQPAVAPQEGINGTAEAEAPAPAVEETPADPAPVATPPEAPAPAVETPPPNAAEGAAAKEQLPALDREKLETSTQLFKALSVLTNGYLCLRISWNLARAANAMSAVNPEVEEQLKELRYLAMLCLEIPIMDPTYNQFNMAPRPQDQSGMGHLTKFMDGSDDKPNIFSYEAQPPAFVPMTQSYAELGALLQRVSQAMRMDPLMQATNVDIQLPSALHPNPMQGPQGQAQMGPGGYPPSAPSNPFTVVPGTEGMIPNAYGSGMGMEGAQAEGQGITPHPVMAAEQQVQVAQHMAEVSAAYGGAPYSVQVPMANDGTVRKRGGAAKEATGAMTKTAAGNAP